MWLSGGVCVWCCVMVFCCDVVVVVVVCCFVVVSAVLSFVCVWETENVN